MRLVFVVRILQQEQRVYVDISMYTHVSTYHLRYRLVRDVDSGANHRRSLPQAVAAEEEREEEWSRTSASGQALTGRAGGGLRWRWVA